MLFSSLVFLWYFLPAVFLLYFITKNLHIRNGVLLAASLFFYAWGEPKYVILMLVSIGLNYFFGLWIGRMQSKHRMRLAVTTCVFLNLLLLGYFKYFNFAVEIANSLLSRFAGGAHTLSFREIALPVGISFYTFQALSYVVDVYRGTIQAQKNIFHLALYISFFPQLIAGPIVKYHDVCEQIGNRQCTAEGMAYGIKRFSYGLAKKMLFANTFAATVDWMMEKPLAQLGTVNAWMLAVLYTLQIYFDFSGYSDMAIGLGRMFGFYFLENFNFPYMSKTITEFWRRWHISLSSWFREYVYIPLGGNRKGLVRQLFNIMVVWMLTGLWHGANWNFVLWGVYYGVLLMIEKLFLLKWLDKLPNWIGHIYSMFLVVIGWTIFAQTDIHQLGEYLKTMFGIGHVAVADSDFLYFLGSNAVLLVALIAASIDYRVWMRRLKQGKDATVYDAIATSKGWTIAKPVLMVVFLLVSFAFLVGDSYNPFLYFRF